MTEKELRRLARKRARLDEKCGAARLELRTAIEQARSEGWSLRRIAAATGLSFARIHQITKEVK